WKQRVAKLFGVGHAFGWTGAELERYCVDVRLFGERPQRSQQRDVLTFVRRVVDAQLDRVAARFEPNRFTEATCGDTEIGTVRIARAEQRAGGGAGAELAGRYWRVDVDAHRQRGLLTLALFSRWILNGEFAAQATHRFDIEADQRL